MGVGIYRILNMALAGLIYAYPQSFSKQESEIYLNIILQIRGRSWSRLKSQSRLSHWWGKKNKQKKTRNGPRQKWLNI